VLFRSPLSAGSSVDIIGRLIAGKLTERFGRPVIVENHGGAGGVVGSEMAARATPDGYTFLVVAALYPINAAVYKLPFDPVKSFTPVAKFGSSTMALVVHPSVPANSVKEFISLAKQKPGQLIWTASGVGSNQHLSAELFKLKTGTDFKIVQFSGGGTAANDLIGGHSHATVSTLAVLLPYIRSGKLRALATTGAKRSDVLPDVPTFAESGLSGYEVTGWWGLIAPAGTPAPIVDRLNKEIKTILTSDELKKFFQSQGAETDYMGPSEFGPYIADEIAQWQQVVKQANIQVQ
jgi:tripartite-type tricarboxylate transporter receptor subunit TctC